MPAVDEQLRRLAAIAEEEPRAKSLLREGLRLSDPTRSGRNVFLIRQILLGAKERINKSFNNRATAKRDEVLQLWRRQAQNLVNSDSRSFAAASSSSNLRASQPEAGVEARVADDSGADNAASSAVTTIALAAQPLETMEPAAVGDIMYATS